jgi:NAD(P)-dependent dehydrogenase (short-subunit alcohol dehydrogenase family)
MSPERRETAEGLEDNLARNVAGPLALTLGLLPLLQRSQPSRIVDVVSSAYKMWKGDPLADLEARERYVPLEVHGRAKQLNILAVLALSRRLAGTGVTINAVNPGMAWTPATEALSPAAVPQWRFIWPVVRWFQRSASARDAARGPVFLAAAPELTFSGRYFDGVREERLPAGLLDPALQDQVLDAFEPTLTTFRVGPSAFRPTIANRSAGG